MDFIYVFEDGVELRANPHPDPDHKHGVLYVIVNENTDQEFHIMIENGYIEIDNLSDNYMRIELKGFSIDKTYKIKGDPLNESDKKQLDIMYNAAKDFIDDANNLDNLYIYVANCEPFDNIKIKNKHNSFYVYNNEKEVFNIYCRSCNSSPSQQECQDKIMELVNKLVIYNTAMSKSATNY